MAPQAPWSPTAHAFALHQFSHVTNFWKQGRPASFHFEALPSGHAKLNLTFQLPHASEVVPPPSHVLPVPPPQCPIPPLFPRGCFSQKFGADSKTLHSPPKKVSSKQRQSFRCSVLHQAALAATSLPPPKNGTLRQAAQACVQRLHANPQSVKKRPLPDSPSALSPKNLLPLAQRIRTDLQIEESEFESPEKVILRSSPFPENSPSPISPCTRSLPSPAPLVFTPSPVKSSCSNCEAEMTPDHQCEASEAFPPDSVIPASSPSFTPPGSPTGRTTGRRIFPKKFVKETEMTEHLRVKCCVCACLGRETSMVLLGSKCPSCGITATDK